MNISFRCAPYVYVSAQRRRDVQWDEVRILFSAPLPKKHAGDWTLPCRKEADDPILLMLAFATGEVTVDDAAAFLAHKDREGFSSTLYYWWQIGEVV